MAAALEGVRAVLGADGTRRVFRAVLTDNGAEFSDEGAIAALLCFSQQLNLGFHD